MSSLKVDCSQWTELDDFSSYIRLLDSRTQFKKDNLEACQSEICTAIYGTGNPDISGIGVAIGYVLEITLSVFLSLAVIVPRQSGKTSQWHRIAKTGLAAFVDSAAYFALSLQLATIAVLVRKDYGISTADLGAIEARISQSVAVVSIVPLVSYCSLRAIDKNIPEGQCEAQCQITVVKSNNSPIILPFPI
jgi:hypothetical protein